jgi:hypothetical protein
MASLLGALLPVLLASLAFCGMQVHAFQACRLTSTALPAAQLPCSSYATMSADDDFTSVEQYTYTMLLCATLSADLDIASVEQCLASLGDTVRSELDAVAPESAELVALHFGRVGIAERPSV